MTPKERNSRKQAQRLKAHMRQRRILNAKKTGKPEIPTKVLDRLASYNLPPSVFVYQAVLEKILRENA